MDFSDDEIAIIISLFVCMHIVFRFVQFELSKTKEITTASSASQNIEDKDIAKDTESKDIVDDI